MLGRGDRLATEKANILTALHHSPSLSGTNYRRLAVNETNETWKPIPGFPHYEASSEGRVRSIDRYLPFRGKKRLYHGRIIAPRPLPNGYQRIAAGRNCDTYIHRLVCLAFHGEPSQPKMDVNHKNGIKSDNRAENLEWMTRSENKKHAFAVLGIRPWNYPKDRM